MCLLACCHGNTAANFFNLMYIIKHAGHQILAVIAEMLAVNGQSAFVDRLVGNGNAEGQLAFVVQLNIIKGNIRNAAAVDKASFIVNPDQLEHPVLIQVRRPPVWIKGTALIPEVSGTGPVTDFDAVYIKVEV